MGQARVRGSRHARHVLTRGSLQRLNDEGRQRAHLARPALTPRILRRQSSPRAVNLRHSRAPKLHPHCLLYARQGRPAVVLRIHRGSQAQATPVAREATLSHPRAETSAVRTCALTRSAHASRGIDRRSHGLSAARASAVASARTNRVRRGRLSHGAFCRADSAVFAHRATLPRGRPHRLRSRFPHPRIEVCPSIADLYSVGTSRPTCRCS